MAKSFKKISTKVSKLNKQPFISEKVANLPEQASDFEDKKVVFSFKKYFCNQCELDKFIQSSDSKKLMAILQRASDVESKHFRYRQVSGIDVKSISNSGNYRKLYNNLSEDEEIVEIVMGDTERIFGFIVRNVFNILLFKKEHIKY